MVRVVVASASTVTCPGVSTRVPAPVMRATVVASVTPTPKAAPAPTAPTEAAPPVVATLTSDSERTETSPPASTSLPPSTSDSVFPCATARATEPDTAPPAAVAPAAKPATAWVERASTDTASPALTVAPWSPAWVVRLITLASIAPATPAQPPPEAART